MEMEIKKPETTIEEEKSKNNESLLESVLNKINVFYNKNKKELIVVLCLLIVYNFICPISYESVSINKQSGGEGEELAQMGTQTPGQGGKGKLKAFAKNLKGFNVLQKMLGWMLSLVQSLITFAGLVLVLAVLPGLPIFIFMLILFFILRARVAVIKAY
jgi:hypothetical protein